MEIRLVNLARYADSDEGLCGGIEFQAARYVSFTLSSQSCSFERMLYAILNRYLPYLFCVSFNAHSSLCQYSSIILSSCIKFPPFLIRRLTHIYRQKSLKVSIFHKYRNIIFQMIFFTNFNFGFCSNTFKINTI